MVLKKRWLLFLLLLVIPLSSANIFLNKEGASNKVWNEAGAINFNGTDERLALLLTIPQNTAGYWIVPIPSDSVTTGALNKFPDFEGEDLKVASRDSLVNIYKWLWASQVYALPYLSQVDPVFSVEKGSEQAKSLMIDKFESSGISAEVVPGDKIQEYLKGKVNLSLVNTYLSNYASNNTSFLVANIKSSNASTSRSMIAYFKTSVPFYPGAGYSLYPEKFPRVVFILDSYDYLNMSTHLYTSKKAFFPKEFFIKEGEGSIDYKRLELGDINQDVYFTSIPEKDYAIILSLKKHPFLWGFFIYIFISMMSSMIAGAIVFRESRPKLFHFLSFGLFNLLSIVGFWVMSYLFKVDESYTEYEKSINQELELTTGKKIALLVPVLLLGLLLIMIPISFLLELSSIFGPIFMSDLFIFLFIPLLVFTILVLWGKFRQEQVLYFNLVFTLSMFVSIVFSFFILLFLL